MGEEEEEEKVGEGEIKRKKNVMNGEEGKKREEGEK